MIPIIYDLAEAARILGFSWSGAGKDLTGRLGTTRAIPRMGYFSTPATELAPSQSAARSAT
jgi:hypothetical protein